MDNRSSTVLALVILAVILAQHFNLPLPWRERVGERGAITATLPTVSPCGYEALAVYGGISLACTSAEVLEELPGIGPKTAERIVAYLEEAGEGATLEGLLAVPGIGRGTLARLKPYLLWTP